jgi:sarcosine oxidase subunit gamma
MLERPCSRSDVTGTLSPAARLFSPALHVREVPGSRIAHLEGARPGPGLESFLAGYGVRSLPGPGRFAAGDTGTLLPIGPSMWLHLGATPAAGAFAVEIDATHAWTRLVVAGSAAPRLLAKGCALDLHPSRFPLGSSAAAGFARLRTIIWRSQQDQFEMLVGRSYARALWEWLIEAAAEFEVVPGVTL